MKRKANLPGRRQRPEDLLEEALKGRAPGDEELEAEISGLARLADEMRQLAPPVPDPAVGRRVWAKLLPAIRQHRASRASTPRPAPRMQRRAWRPGLAWIGMLAGLGLLAASAGTAFASEEALPGDLLYPIKRGIERARIALSWSSEGDAALLLDFADERLQEAEALARAGDDAAMGDALRGYDEALDQVMGLIDDLPVEDGEGSIAGLEDHLSRHLEVLARVQSQVPPNAAEAIGAAIERTSRRQDEAERIRGGEGDDDIPPGQVGRTPGPPENPGRGPDPKDHPANGNRGQSSGNDNPGQGPPETPGPP